MLDRVDPSCVHTRVLRAHMNDYSSVRLDSRAPRVGHRLKAASDGCSRVVSYYCPLITIRKYSRSKVHLIGAAEGAGLKLSSLRLIDDKPIGGLCSVDLAAHECASHGTPDLMENGSCSGTEQRCWNERFCALKHAPLARISCTH